MREQGIDAKHGARRDSQQLLPVRDAIEPHIQARSMEDKGQRQVPEALGLSDATTPLGLASQQVLEFQATEELVLKLRHVEPSSARRSGRTHENIGEGYTLRAILSHPFTCAVECSSAGGATPLHGRHGRDRHGADARAVTVSSGRSNRARALRLAVIAVRLGAQRRLRRGRWQSPNRP
jgi:hypothetical protein